MLARRQILTALAGALAYSAVGTAMAQRFVAGQSLKPGEFLWEPERSPSGAVVMIVSLPEQLVPVYRNGIEIGVSTCSTGKEGHRTPAGVFTILEKQREHVSSIYKGAQMPNMERLTWSGIALHAGNLPGYPASHGCVRLPLKFSALLYEVTHTGVVVIIADERTQPATVVHPGVLMPVVADAEARSISNIVSQKRAHSGWEAEVRYPISSVVISRADGKAYVTQDGVLQGSYPVKIARQAQPVGTHVYALVGPAADGSGLVWLAFGTGKSRRDPHIVTWQGDTTLRRIGFYDRQRALQIAQTFHPGTTLTITDMSAPRPTRSTPGGFKVIASDTPA